MDEIVKVILTAKRKRFLRSRPVFERAAPVSEAELFRLATGLNFRFPLGLSRWLLRAGYGDIDETLSFREDRFSVVGDGPLSGHVLFAQDVSGNHYAFNPKDGSIYLIKSAEQGIARISDDFAAFLQELIRRDYKLQDWVTSLPVSKQAQ